MPRISFLLALALTVFVPALPAQGIVVRVAPPASVGLDSVLLAGATRAADSLPALTSLLVWRRGALGYERYLHGGSPDAPVNVKSVSKSFLSALIGAAVGGGRIGAIDRPVAEVLPESYGPAGGQLFTDARQRSDSLRRRVTLRHLLTMTSGLAWEESNPTLVYALLLSSNPVRFAAELPVLVPPGTGFNYSTASSHLAAGAVSRLIGTSLREFGEQFLFGPAGIVVTRWDADPQGVNFGGSEMFLTPREMLKLGILYLGHGKVGDRQIVPADWVAASVAKQTEVTTPIYRHMVPGLSGYGYFWWLRTAEGREMYCALGLGGQFVLVVPSLELVVAGTSSLDARNPGNDAQFNGIFALVDHSIVRAAK
jgi:CubicO group peptidase (beta-lactamase class C family)